MAAVPLWNGSLTLGLNFRDGSNASWALAHINAAKAFVSTAGHHLWDWVEQVEVGNEVDAFSSNGIRDPSYTYADYAEEFAYYAKEIVAVAGPGKIQGATYCCWNSFSTFVPEYVTRFSNPRALGTLSMHRYALSDCGHHTVQMWRLLNDSAGVGEAERIKPWVDASLAVGTPYIVGEGNSISCGGQIGISDTFAATLWAADILLNFAAIGVTRWNFHGEPSGGYSAVWYNNPDVDDAEVKALYYALWAVNTLIARSAQVVNVTTLATTNTYVKVWSVVDSQGAQRVMVVHKDMFSTGPATVTITLPAGVTNGGSAVLSRLLPGPQGINSTSGLSFGGLTFDNTGNGVPVGTPTHDSIAPSADKTSYTFTVDPLTIALLYIPK